MIGIWLCTSQWYMDKPKIVSKKKILGDFNYYKRSPNPSLMQNIIVCQKKICQWRFNLPADHWIKFKKKNVQIFGPCKRDEKIVEYKCSSCTYHYWCTWKIFPKNLAKKLKKLKPERELNQSRQQEILEEIPGEYILPLKFQWKSSDSTCV